MLKQLLKGRSKPKSPRRGERESALYKALFEFLIGCIAAPANAEQLIQLGSKAAGKDTEEVFHTYLLFEKYLTTFESEQYDRRSLRERVRQRFPVLLQDSSIFNILFVSETEQKNTLAIHFLQPFLAAVRDKFGRAGDGYFERKIGELTELDKQRRDPEAFRKLQFLSFDVFKFIGNNYGEPLAGKIFEKSYDSFSNKYKELEFFPYMITLVPKEIVDREHLGIFTQSQIEQIFLEKLAESEQLNIALDQKIKENERTQRLLRKNEIMLSGVISSALDAIVITGAYGHIIHWNQAAVEIFGYTEKEVKGRTLLETILPLSYDHTHWNGFPGFPQNDVTPMLNQRHELTAVRKNKEEFPIELTVTAIVDENESYYSAFIRDISSRRQREQELVQMKEKAEQAAKAKSQFLSVMSHELRTPLNAVIGITHLLLQSQPREDQQEDLRTLQFSGESLLHIINDILDFTKLDSGKIELSAIDFNLRELTQSLYQSFSYKAREKNIVFDVECDDRMPFYVRGDNFRLSQVLNNLISNAIKFTHEGFVKLKVEMVENTGSHFITRFSVVDSGIGIPEEKQEKIFEQFTQADSDTTRLYGGTGLGLSISGRLVELMGSSILVASTPGKGSSFSFTLDLLQGSHSDPNAGLAKVVNKSNDAFRNKLILLAEDNVFNANIARRFITGWGAQLEVVVDGRQALEFVSRRKYDLILMDVQMPVLDGFACTRKIRKHFKEVPILAITASPKNEIINEIIACGMNDFVSKPFKPNELRSKLLEYL
ncbi:MAG TPA: ATP-binding protein [Puia sp.]|uniref:PAS domain-containing hybrid sensor histidine kinase/response regulator n=1 Tax=Puia sp. TaxID=2045100 RepID=UPI002BC6A300|nr:ATP-binding protein [Puia sp.]HVU95892.1 ATP-binding protein [Puia sp.]